MDAEALLTHKETWKAAVEFGTIMLWFYVADRTQLLIPTEKV